MLEREINIIEKQYDWPDNYYMETDSAKRKKYLEEAIAQDNSRENQLRLLLWQKRYCDAKGKVDGIDHFLKIWTNLPFVVKQKNGLFHKGRTKKFLTEMEDTYQWNLLAEEKEFQHIWFREFVNFCCFYIEISRTDKTYASTLFGIGKLSDNTLSNKLANDFYEKTVTFPRELGIEKHLELLAEAATKAIQLYFPNRD